MPLSAPPEVFFVSDHCDLVHPDGGAVIGAEGPELKLAVFDDPLGAASRQREWSRWFPMATAFRQVRLYRERGRAMRI